MMNKTINWVREHQVITFFIIAFAITWPAFILVYFVFPSNPLIKVLVGGPLGVFSPALAAMLISAIADPRPKQTGSKPRWIAFLVSWLISWLIMTLYYWRVEKMELVPATIVWGAFALLPAWILSSAFAKTPGIREQFSTLLKPRGNLRWYLVALLLVPVTTLLGVGITRLLGGVVQSGPLQILVRGLSPDQTIIILALFYLSGFLCSGGINEESGWRGFALPRLQRRYPVLIAIGIVWFFWALWHIPLYIGLRMPINWIIQVCTISFFHDSIFLAWVYNRTKGSILAPALLHPSINTFGNLYPILLVTTILFIGLAVFAILYDRMWKKLSTNHPAVYQKLGLDEKNIQLSHL
jgi:membrane protease YdiL (CAAX protease family)